MSTTDYLNWDTSDHAAYKSVVSYTRHICGPDGYTAGTTPTQKEVYAFLDDAYYEIVNLLEANGYSYIQTNANVMGNLQRLQGIKATISVELTAPVSVVSDVMNARASAFNTAAGIVVTQITGSGLEQLGATRPRARGAFVTATGVLRSRKLDNYTNTDLAQPRFRRGFGQSPLVPENIVDIVTDLNSQ